MPSFADPYNAIVKKLTKAELIQELRLDIAGELEAIYLYDAHVLATDDPIAKAVLGDIRDEEKAHIGELMALLRHLDPAEAEHFAEGEKEVRELMEEMGINAAAQKPQSLAQPSSTVGSLREGE